MRKLTEVKGLAVGPPVVSVQLGLMQVYEAQVEKAPAFNHRAP